MCYLLKNTQQTYQIQMHNLKISACLVLQDIFRIQVSEYFYWCTIIMKCLSLIKEWSDSK